MYLKLLGAVQIIIAAYFYGCHVSSLYRKRVRELEEILMALEIFWTEVDHGLTLLPQTFSFLGPRIKKPIGSLFSEAAKCMEPGRGLSARECWEEALGNNFSALHLNRHQFDLVKRLGEIWGKGNREGQRRQIVFMQDLLRQALREAQKEKQKNERIWKYLGLMGGITIVIFLF